MLRYILSLSFILGISSVFSQENIEISLLTCTPGEEIHSTFGHSAIRVKDSVTGLDTVYDYGTFNFKTPNFTIKFILGKLKYRLSVSDFEKFKAIYISEGKGVIEEVFDLSKDDKQKFYALLKENQKLENRYYYYDFFYDNCSTRIRDIVEKLNNVKTPKNKSTGKTYSSELNEFFVGKKWLGFGINLILGMPAYKIMSFRDQMFLPKYLSQNLKRYTNTINGKSLLCPPQLIVKNTINISSSGISPVALFLAVLVIVVALIFFRPNLFSKMVPVFYFLLGLVSVLLLFLWFGTVHKPTKYNLNILWASPLYGIVLFLKNRKFRAYLLVTILVINLFLLITHLWLPQKMHFTYIIIIIALLVINVSQIKVYLTSIGFIFKAKLKMLIK